MGLEPRGHASWSASGRENFGYKVEFPRESMTSPYPVRDWKRGCFGIGFFCQGYVFDKGHSPLFISVGIAEEVFCLKDLRNNLWVTRKR